MPKFDWHLDTVTYNRYVGWGIERFETEVSYSWIIWLGWMPLYIDRFK